MLVYVTWTRPKTGMGNLRSPGQMQPA